MAEPLPPDPYQALGVPRDATSAAIKSAYRKAALKCHPDKAKGREDEFHRIQSAFELIGDDDKREKYDSTVYLEQLRREQQQRRGGRPHFDVRNATFEVRVPPSASASFGTRSSARGYDDRRSKPAYDDDHRFFEQEASRASARKYDGYEAPPRKPPRPSKAPEEPRREPKMEKPSPKEREQQKKQRDRDTERERNRKYSAYAEELRSDSDEGFFDKEPRSRAFEREVPRRASEDYRYDRLAADARDYIGRSKGDAYSSDMPSAAAAPPPPPPPPPPPAFARSNPNKEPEIGVRRASKDGRPAMVKRGSTRSAKEKTPEPVRRSTSNKDRKSSKEPETVAGGAKEDRRPPPIKTSFTFTSPSSPSPTDARRSKTGVEYEIREPSKPPRLGRAETMPARPQFRRDDTMPTTPSNLRHTETNDSGYSTSNSPSSTPPPPSYTKYKYGDGANDEVNMDGSGFVPDFREPVYDRTRQRSPEEMARAHSTTTRRPPPQPSRSASYQAEPPLKKGSRRPSISRANSGPRNLPNLQRGASMPMPKTGRGDFETPEGFLFGEIPRATSPSQLFDREAYDRERNFAKQAPADHREFLRRSSAGGEAFGNRAAGREFTRRSSEDYQARNAQAYMDEVRERETAYRSPPRRQAAAH